MRCTTSSAGGGPNDPVSEGIEPHGHPCSTRGSASHKGPHTTEDGNTNGDRGARRASQHMRTAARTPHRVGVAGGGGGEGVRPP